MADFDPQRCSGCPAVREVERSNRARDERLSRFETDYYSGHSEVLKKLDLLIQYLGAGMDKTKVTP